MAKFLLLGKYSAEAIQGMTPERTKKALEIVEKAGGKVDSMYALLGNYDLAFMMDFPKITDVMIASASLTKLTGIAFTTSPAVSIEEFDKITG